MRKPTQLRAAVCIEAKAKACVISMRGLSTIDHFTNAVTHNYVYKTISTIFPLSLFV